MNTKNLRAITPKTSIIPLSQGVFEGNVILTGGTGSGKNTYLLHTMKYLALGCKNVVLLRVPPIEIPSEMIDSRIRQINIPNEGEEMSKELKDFFIGIAGLVVLGGTEDRKQTFIGVEDISMANKLLIGKIPGVAENSTTPFTDYVEILANRKSEDAGIRFIMCSHHLGEFKPL